MPACRAQSVILIEIIISYEYQFGSIHTRILQLLSTPIHYRRLVRVFERDGWSFSRQRGDHLVYTKPDNIRPLVIPAYDEVPVFVIRNLLRTTRMSRERYFELLEEV